MMQIFSLISVFLLIGYWTQPAFADDEPRIALVVGNDNYTHIGDLRNPVNDAVLMKEALEKVGFDVSILINANRSSFEREIRLFGEKLRADPETVGLFYYAGHGVQSFGTNYLLPVDTQLSSQADLDLVAIQAQSVLRQMYSARNASNIVILDACRNNPFEATIDITDNGLAEMRAPTGTYLAYATAPGMVAYDGEAENSPFSRALAEQIVTQDGPIEQTFKAVRVSVLEETNGLQTPWDASSLTRDFHFQQLKTGLVEDQIQEKLWQTVYASGDIDQLRLFLSAYPNSRHADEARDLIKATTLVATHQVPLSPAPKPKPEVNSEAAALQLARQEGTVAALEAFITDYSDSVYVELAKAEIAALNASLGAPSSPNELSLSAPSGINAASGQTAPADPMDKEPALSTLETALANPKLLSSTRSLTDFISNAAPNYAPMEGLPKELWAGQSCGACHQWDQARLCEQGQSYAANENLLANAGKHPFGGVFKERLRDWAAGGCQN